MMTMHLAWNFEQGPNHHHLDCNNSNKQQQKETMNEGQFLAGVLPCPGEALWDGLCTLLNKQPLCLDQVATLPCTAHHRTCLFIHYCPRSLLNLACEWAEL
jgi:hypothetical protein